MARLPFMLRVCLCRAATQVHDGLDDFPLTMRHIKSAAMKLGEGSSLCSPRLHEDSKRMPGDIHSCRPCSALHAMHSGLEQPARMYLYSIVNL